MMKTSDNGPQSFKLMGTGAKFQEELCSMLEETWMFSGFEWRDIEAVAKYVQGYEAKEKSTLFREGDPGTFMVLIVEGNVGIFKEDSNREEKCVALVGHGKTLGEMAIIDGEPRSATCITATPAKLIILTKDNFGRILNDHPALGVKIVMKIARLLSQRLRKTSGLLVDYLEN